jgi:hypothetical protein
MTKLFLIPFQKLQTFGKVKYIDNQRIRINLPPLSILVKNLIEFFLR